MKKEKQIEKLQKAIKILENDLKKYGSKSKKIADYDNKWINIYKNEINKLKGSD